MFTKYMTSFLIIVLICLQSTVVFGQTKNDKEAKKLAKFKAAIVKLGVGQDAGIKVRLKDGTKLNGYVSARDDDGFDVTAKKTGVVTNVKYSDVKGVKGKNIPLGVQIALGVGFAVGILAIIGLLCKEFCS